MKLKRKLFLVHDSSTKKVSVRSGIDALKKKVHKHFSELSKFRIIHKNIKSNDICRTLIDTTEKLDRLLSDTNKRFNLYVEKGRPRIGKGKYWQNKAEIWGGEQFPRTVRKILKLFDRNNALKCEEIDKKLRDGEYKGVMRGSDEGCVWKGDACVVARILLMNGRKPTSSYTRAAALIGSFRVRG